MGVKSQYAQILLQGIRNPETKPQAIQFLQQAHQANEISDKVLLQMYEQLNHLDGYFSIANRLAESFQYDVLTSYRFNAMALRQHPDFSSLMDKINLLSYWNSVEYPTFCLNKNYDFCRQTID